MNRRNFFEILGIGTAGLCISKGDLYSQELNSKAGRFISLLQEYPDFYSGNDWSGFPTWEYMGPNNENLIELREKYCLDEIAGNGSQRDKLTKLLEWVSEVIEHDGFIDSPEPRNALHIIETCQREKRGVNCAIKAQVLTEVYLSMDFKSRRL